MRSGVMLMAQQVFATCRQTELRESESRCALTRNARSRGYEIRENLRRHYRISSILYHSERKDFLVDRNIGLVHTKFLFYFLRVSTAFLTFAIFYYPIPSRSEDHA